MTLSIQISGQEPNEVKASIAQRYTGERSELHQHICNLIEPAVYEALRLCVANGVVGQIMLRWDDRTFRIKSHEPVHGKTVAGIPGEKT
jgi:hypothetical protein